MIFFDNFREHLLDVMKDWKSDAFLEKLPGIVHDAETKIYKEFDLLKDEGLAK